MSGARLRYDSSLNIVTKEKQNNTKTNANVTGLSVKEKKKNMYYGEIQRKVERGEDAHQRTVTGPPVGRTSTTTIDWQGAVTALRDCGVTNSHII